MLIVDIDLPHQLAAYQLGCDRHDPFVADLEARILAGQAPEEISRNLAVTPAIVKTYEAWFFNVNDRLEHPSWVTQCVLGSDYHRGRIHQDISLLWKAVAYFGTGESLDELIYGFQGIRHLQTPQEVSDFFRKDCFNQVRLRAAIALRTIDPADQQQALQLLRQWAQQRELELKGKGETDDDSALEQSVSTAFEGISAALAPVNMTAEPRQQTEAVTEPGDPFL